MSTNDIEEVDCPRCGEKCLYRNNNNPYYIQCTKCGFDDSLEERQNGKPFDVVLSDPTNQPTVKDVIDVLSPEYEGSQYSGYSDGLKLPRKLYGAGLEAGEDVTGHLLTGIFDRIDIGTEAQYFTLGNEIMLQEYWNSRGYDIDGDESVIRIVVGDDNEYDFPVSRVFLPRLEDISGISKSKAIAFREQDYNTVVDLAIATQTELASFEGIGNALSARVKANVGDITKADAVRAGLIVKDEQDETSSTVQHHENSVTCPVNGCTMPVTDENFYDHMLTDHGWYSEQLLGEVEDLMEQ